MRKPGRLIPPMGGRRPGVFHPRSARPSRSRSPHTSTFPDTRAEVAQVFAKNIQQMVEQQPQLFQMRPVDTPMDSEENISANPSVSIHPSVSKSEES